MPLPQFHYFTTEAFNAAAKTDSTHLHHINRANDGRLVTCDCLTHMYRVPISHAVARRQQIERRIMRKVIRAFLHAGYALGVFDGEETTVYNSREFHAIYAALMTTDEDYLYVYAPGNPDGKVCRSGWVRLVYGNDGWDVICDYTTNLEAMMEPIMEYADSLS